MKHLFPVISITCLLSASSIWGQQDSVSLVFVGDMMQHDAQIEAAYDSISGKYVYEDYFTYIGPIVQKADIAVCNFEVSLAGKPYKGYPMFSAPDEYLDAIINAGFDVFLTANNHCIDKGKKGLERTISMMIDKRVIQLGTYKDSADRARRYPIILESKGVKIAMLNYTYGTNGLIPKKPNIVNYIDTAIIARDIKKCHQMRADYIIANIHWGIENTHEQNKEQKQLAKILVDMGVDHIIGGHPHMVQPAEIISDKKGGKHFVIYSLGNVVSNMQKKGNDGGIIVGLDLPLNKDLSQEPHVWYTQFHVAKPYECGMKNYNAYTPTVPDSILPQGEKERREEFYFETRQIINNGYKIEEVIQ